MDLFNKWPIMVEIIEDRQGNSRFTYFTKGQRVFLKPSNVSVYKIKGLQRDIIAPDYRHLDTMPKGAVLLRLWSPNPDDYYVLALEDYDAVVKSPTYTTEEVKTLLGKKYNKKTLSGTEDVLTKIKKLSPVIDEESKAWVDWQIEKSHEDWTKKGFMDKYALFLMLIVIGIVMMAGIKFQADALVKVGDASGNLMTGVTKVSGDIEKYSDNMNKVVDRIDRLLNKYNISSGQIVVNQGNPVPPI